MNIAPYLTFNGQCEEAFHFYATALGGRVEVLMPYGDSPMAEKVSKEWLGKIIHATLKIGNQTIAGADSFPGSYQKPQGFHITLNLQSSDEAERVFMALSEKGEVTMPIQETFWAERFGMLNDQFGQPWMINYGKLDGT